MTFAHPSVGATNYSNRVACFDAQIWTEADATAFHFRIERGGGSHKRGCVQPGAEDRT